MPACEVCRPKLREPDDDGLPGYVVEAMPGATWHRSDCPLVDLPRETKQKLQAQLREFDRARLRAAALARTAVVG